MRSILASLTNVTIGNNVTYIGNDLFAGCVSLTAISVDAANPTYSSLEGVLFDNGQTVLIVYPGGKGGSYTIPGSVGSIGDAAFSGCSRLTTVTIPDSVTNLGFEAFLGCSSLTAITVDAANPSYSSVDGVLFNKSQNQLIQCPGGKAGSFTIPNSVTSIGDNAFWNCTSLTSITIPNSVNSMGDGAFVSCTSLTAVHFQGNAPSIGSGVFYGDNNATVYYLPGTTGWGPTFASAVDGSGGRSALLWNPLVQTGNASFGVRTESPLPPLAFLEFALRRPLERFADELPGDARKKIGRQMLRLGFAVLGFNQFQGVAHEFFQGRRGFSIKRFQFRIQLFGDGRHTPTLQPRNLDGKNELRKLAFIKVRK